MKRKKISNLISKVALLEKRNADFLHVTANENQLSKTANSFLDSKLSERYFFGEGDKDCVIDFGLYTFCGLPAVQDLVLLASQSLKKMIGAKVVNLNCFSGLHAMMLAILVSTKPGDTVMSIPFESGGHSATQGIVKSLGRKHVFAKFNPKHLDFDVPQTAKIFKKAHANTLYIDISAHLNPVSVLQLRKALGKQAVIIYDASHSFGLILGGVFKSPFTQGADIICTNTHKTFAGPQRGIILFKNQAFGEKANFTINTAYISSVHTAELMALCISLLEYAEFGKDYAKQVVKNSNALAKAFDKQGYELRRSSDQSFSQNEQIHLFIDKLGNRVDLYRQLIKNNISTNFMQIFGGRPFARLGTQEITRRGMKEKDMIKIAQLIDRALKKKNVKNEVIRFTRNFPDIKYSFDHLQT